jgi:chromate transporter
MILPSFCIIFAISVYLDRFLEITWIAHAFQGIKIAAGILILDAAVRMLKKMPKKVLPRVFMLCAFTAMLLINIFSVRISSIILMLTAGLVSLIIFMARKASSKGGDGK